MNPRHINTDDTRTEAKRQLSAAGVPQGAQFHALSSAQVSALLTEADRARYRTPRNANGSRARYFHDMLQRRAARKES